MYEDNGFGNAKVYWVIKLERELTNCKSKLITKFAIKLV